MTSTEAADLDPQEATDGADSLAAAEAERSERQAPEEQDSAQRAPEQQEEVQLVRTVRYGRLLVAGAIVGAVIAGVVAMLLPVPDGATYELGQAVGVALIAGAIIGLALGGALALLLGLVAKRSRGAALAMHSDVG